MYLFKNKDWHRKSYKAQSFLKPFDTLPGFYRYFGYNIGRIGAHRDSKRLSEFKEVNWD